MSSPNPCHHLHEVERTTRQTPLSVVCATSVRTAVREQEQRRALQSGMRKVTQYAAPTHRVQLAQPGDALHLHINKVFVITLVKKQRRSDFG